MSAVGFVTTINSTGTRVTIDGAALTDKIVALRRARQEESKFSWKTSLFDEVVIRHVTLADKEDMDTWLFRTDWSHIYGSPGIQSGDTIEIRIDPGLDLERVRNMFRSKTQTSQLGTVHSLLVELKSLIDI